MAACAAVAVAGPVGCASPGSAAGGQGTTARPAPAKAPATVEQVRLLSLADEIAGTIPGEDFEVDRSLCRAGVVDCCIELGELDRAEAFAARIENWRRGDALVRLGQARLERGDRAGAERCAAACLSNAGNWRDWGIARVAAGAAALYMALGEPDRAKGLLPPDAPDLMGAFEASRVPRVALADLPAMADAFDAALSTQNLDVARSALDGHLAVLGRALAAGDSALAGRCAAALDRGIAGLPPDMQVGYRLRLSELLSGAGRTDGARAEVAKAGDAYRNAILDAQSRASIGVPIAEAEFRLGERAGALARIDALRADFEEHKAEITDLRRATSLRALAEGYLLVGERARGSECYAQALREGAVNPNARPRANDLCDTLVSMARSGYAPDAGMQRTIDSIRAGLAAPW